ncbi:DUF4369 domain-containing protein [Aequorivita echinoideorum]|uniref:DUF4369 domain-containing protein n=1 Tax=Aequorivita echinoideorum TaxID=1549647 RepID=A0ABS5S548_9FLAO|nr:DUF4369 domain-containing protein [Aequorivita echinoideorum]MBT0608344.1 DUF4369 domain-containing protein [Aequorivita echinoideorum]
MKYSFFAITVILFLIGCASENNSMNLTGNVKGLKKGTLLLQKIEDTALITVDSIVINGDSNFSFSEKIESPEIYYLYVRLKDGTLMDDRITFFAENKPININTKLERFGSSAVVTGSVNDSILKEYNKLMQRYIDKNLEIIQNRLTKTEGNDSLSAIYEKQQNSLLSSKYFATINFAMNKKEYEVAPYVILSEAYNARVQYLDTVYKALAPKIKDSKYGKELESFIKERKKLDTIAR